MVTSLLRQRIRFQSQGVATVLNYLEIASQIFFFSFKTVNTQSVSVSCSVYEFSREICVAPPYSRLHYEEPQLAKHVT